MHTFVQHHSELALLLPLAVSLVQAMPEERSRHVALLHVDDSARDCNDTSTLSLWQQSGRCGFKSRSVTGDAGRVGRHRQLR